MKGPPGPLTPVMDPGGEGKVADGCNILNPGAGFGVVTLWPQADTPKCYSFGTGIWRDWRGAWPRDGWAESKSMRDILIVIVFVAMVLTPAVIAARSGQDLFQDE